MSRVRVKVEGRFAGVSARALGKTAGAMLRALRRPRAELSILVVGDDEMRVLNRTYRRKDRPTDVLAFAQHEGEFGERAGPLLGDVVVSVPTARRQAEEHGRSLAHELDALLAHGILHLLGWDHPTAAKERAMNREAERLCEAAQRVRPRRSSRRRTSSSRSRR